ncbi:MAG: hypothetical protein AAFX08_08115 [Pseudomonadota bacterium]
MIELNPNFGDDDFREQFQKYVDWNSSMLSVIITSHLFIERVLGFACARALKNPDALEIQNMKFHHRLNLFRALYDLDIGIQRLPEAVRSNVVRAPEACQHLNKIRNEVAHNLDTDDAALLIDEAISWQLAEAGERGLSPLVHTVNRENPKTMQFAGFVYSVYFGIIGEVKSAETT